jgi:hypothetical protein
MKIFSYTDKRFPPPPDSLKDDRWPVQFTTGFSEFYHQFYGGEILLFHDDEKDAWLPFHRSHNKLIRFGQILHAPVSSFIELTAEQQTAFFNKLISSTEKEQLIHRFIQPHPFGIMLSYPEKSKAVRFGTYITDLTRYPTDEALLGSYDPKYKKAIQHSVKNGANVVFGGSAREDFYHLYRCTAQRTGMYQDPAEYFTTLHRCLQDENTETGVVYDGDTPIGGIQIIYSKYAALCTHAGSSAGDSKLYGGMKYLHFEMMKRLRNKGVRNYDLVGVRIGRSNPALEGVFRFKKGFGGCLKEGYLWKADLNGVILRIYDRVQSLRNPNMKPDIIDQEIKES